MSQYCKSLAILTGLTTAIGGASLRPERSCSIRRFAAILAVFTLFACHKPGPSPAETTAGPIARAFYEEVRTGADLSGDPNLARELKTPATQDQLSYFRALIPAEAPSSVERRLFDVKTDSTGETTLIVDAYRYSDRTLIAQTALFRSPAGRTPVIVGFNLSREAADGS